MPNMAVLLQALDDYLADKGFYVHLSRVDQETGHTVRAQIADIKASPGVASSCSRDVYVKGLLDAMRNSNVTGWDESKARSALEAAEFDPDKYL